MVSSLAVANTFIDEFGGQFGIQHMKLQKLVYYSHAWWLSAEAEPFLNERPQVWKYGPVFGDLYHNLKGFGSRPITSMQSGGRFNDVPDRISEDNNELMPLIEWIWARYGGMTAEELSERTHRTGTPWRIIAEQNHFRVPKGKVIDDQTIRTCFSGDPSEILKVQ
ncbi:Panacea domain-containing protein [Asticcacaulis sp.]|uniref:Panacea domain-containing protein n=1 Tax=Asticcacaulis sp. TaxID=1872648 RepID=UPI003F7BBE32